MAFKAVLLEGLEVVFIVIAVGVGRGLFLPASPGAFAATSSPRGSDMPSLSREIRVLRVRQGKTGKSLDIELSGELEKLINECLAEAVVHQTFVHRDDGKLYTYDGISCMFRRYVKKCGLKDFGFYDLKGKAATDMYRAGVPLEQIQHLLGHTSIKTTEIYIKARLPDLVAPTSRPMVKQQAGDSK